MKRVVGAVVLLLLITATPSLADRLTGSENFLCSSGFAARCWVEGTCESGPPWMWNIPDFVRFDLENELIETTRASGEHRESAIDSVERVDGLIVVQGYEEGRAVSILISEATGRATLAVVLEDSSVTAFGVCTPLDAKE